MQNNTICHENSIANTPSETISPYCVFVTPWIDYLFFAYFFYFCKPCHALLNSLGGMYVDKLDPGKLQIYYVYRSYAFEKCNLYCLYRVKIEKDRFTFSFFSLTKRSYQKMVPCSIDLLLWAFEQSFTGSPSAQLQLSLKNSKIIC